MALMPSLSTTLNRNMTPEKVATRREPLNIVIVGGSLAGLMHGIMMKRLGHNVHILEQYPSSFRDGEAAGISTGARAQDFLQKYDLITEPCVVHASALQIMDSDFKRKSYTNWPLALTTWKTLYCRLRANFDGLSSDCVKRPPAGLEGDGKAIYDAGKRVRDITYGEGIVTLLFEDIVNGGDCDIHADLVIAADGSQSKIRKLLLPDVRSPYAGYLTWRAIIPERNISESTGKLFQGLATSYAMHKSYVIVYLIPGQDGNLNPGERHFNFVWYYNCSENSQEFNDIMTDKDGHRHRSTLPPGKIRPDVWAKQQALGEKIFAAPMKELISQITNPFVTAISDHEASRATFFDGRVLLVGDALALFRPHLALSTDQAARHCLSLEKVLLGNTTVQEWEKEVLQHAHVTRLKSSALGTWHLSGVLVGLYYIFRYILAEVGQRMGLLI